MTIISDATALILLSKVGLLEALVKKNAIFIPKKVYEEVVKGREKGRLDSLIVEKLIQESKIKIKMPNKQIKNRIEKLFNIKGGELEVISLAYKTKSLILTDDKKCINIAKTLNLDFANSLNVIISLYKKKQITKQKALWSIERLEDFGWYNKDLIKNSKEELKWWKMYQ